MRVVAILLGIVFAAPAAAQFAADQPTWLVADEDEAPSGVVVHPLNGGGLNLSRPGLMVHGFRVAPETGAFMGYRQGNWLFGSTLTQADEAFSDSSTAALDLGATYGVDLSPKQRLSVEGGIRFDLSSGLGLRTPYTLAPGASDNGLGLRMSWRYSFDRNRFVSTSLGFEQNLGDSFDGGSGERNGATFGTTFGYRFY